MGTQDPKAVARRFTEVIEEYWRTGNADLLDEVVPENFVHHAAGMPADREGMKQVLPMFRNAFPDMKLSTEILLAEGDKVVDLIRVNATHQGELMGVPATGRPVQFSEIHIARVVDGKIVERWSQIDMLAILQQIGAIPAPEQSPATA